ncbi:MAG: hypothetical protein KBC34_11545 [Phenylobacterium sp.]|nr:hypothetical protein [Phenylobacterium sp.]
MFCTLQEVSCLGAVSVVVDEAQDDLGLGVSLQPLQRQEAGLVVALARNRHMHEVERTFEAGHYRVDHGDNVQRVFRLHGFFVSPGRARRLRRGEAIVVAMNVHSLPDRRVASLKLKAH